MPEAIEGQGRLPQSDPEGSCAIYQVDKMCRLAVGVGEQRWIDVRFEWEEIRILTHLDGASWTVGGREPNERLRGGGGNEDAVADLRPCVYTEKQA